MPIIKKLYKIEFWGGRKWRHLRYADTIDDAQRLADAAALPFGGAKPVYKKARVINRSTDQIVYTAPEEA